MERKNDSCLCLQHRHVGNLFDRSRDDEPIQDMSVARAPGASSFITYTKNSVVAVLEVVRRRLFVFHAIGLSMCLCASLTLRIGAVICLGESSPP